MSAPEQLTPSAASDRHWRALAHHLELIRAERMPGDPPVSVESRVASLRQPDPAKDWLHLLLWEQDRVVARATLALPRTPSRQHEVDVDLSVLAPARQRGLARRLLTEIDRLTHAAGRSSLLTTASSRLPSGEAVLRHLGAHVVMTQQFMELDLRGLDPGRLTDWVQSAAQAAPDYHIWSHLGPYPPDRLPAIAPVYDVMQTAPQGTRTAAAARMTADALRRQDEQQLTAGRQRLTTFAEHRPSGAVVAFTELWWDTARPTIMIQHGTAVDPAHRRHALGRWIKAANLLAAQRVNSAVRAVRAGNTDDNTGMLRINRALGFDTYLIHTDWQLDARDLRRYVQR